MFHRCFLQSFGSFGQAVSEKKIDQSEQKLPVVSMFANGSDWSGSKKYSLKSLVQKNRQFGGSIYGSSSIKIANFVPIR
jgi:hypothetical protein